MISFINLFSNKTLEGISFLIIKMYLPYSMTFFPQVEDAFLHILNELMVFQTKT